MKGLCIVKKTLYLYNSASARPASPELSCFNMSWGMSALAKRVAWQEAIALFEGMRNQSIQAARGQTEGISWGFTQVKWWFTQLKQWFILYTAWWSWFHVNMDTDWPHTLTCETVWWWNVRINHGQPSDFGRFCPNSEASLVTTRRAPEMGKLVSN